MICGRSLLKDRVGWDNGRLIVLRDITERVRAGEILDRSEAILEAVNFAATRFLSAAVWEEAIGEVLQRFGEAAEVSRTYIFENHRTPDGSPLTSQRYRVGSSGHPGANRQSGAAKFVLLKRRDWAGGKKAWRQTSRSSAASASFLPASIAFSAGSKSSPSLWWGSLSSKPGGD